MKSQIITTVVFILLFAGFQFQANGQASASVNYTIVVTEDMLAGVNDIEPRGFGFGMRNHKADAPSNHTANVSVSLHTSTDGADLTVFSAFETVLPTFDTPAITNALKAQLTDSFTDQNYAVCDTGQYFVVMEYN